MIAPSREFKSIAKTLILIVMYRISHARRKVRNRTHSVHVPPLSLSATRHLATAADLTYERALEEHSTT